MDDFRNKLDALKITKEEKNGTKLNVYFEYYETADNLLEGVMTIHLMKTGGIGKLFGESNLSLQQAMGMEPEVTITYTGNNRPKKSNTNSTIFDLYLMKRHPIIYKMYERHKNHIKNKEKIELDSDFYDDEDDDMDDEF